MNRLDATTEAYLLAAAKTALPATGAKLSQLNALALKFHRDIQKEPNTEWDWLYEVITAGKVTATDTFELDRDINFISTASQRELNRVRVLHNGNTDTFTEFTSCTPAQLFQNRHGNYVAKISENRIQFSRKFVATDSTFGGTIQVPAIVKLDPLSKDTAEVPPEMETWLPARIAAQYAFSYTSLRSMYDDLLALSNEQLQGMKERNTSGNESTSTGVDYFAAMGNG